MAGVVKRRIARLEGERGGGGAAKVSVDGRWKTCAARSSSDAVFRSVFNFRAAIADWFLCCVRRGEGRCRGERHATVVYIFDGDGGGTRKEERGKRNDG